MDGWMDACVEYDLEEISEAVKELERTKKIPEGAFLGGTKVPDAVVKACKTYVDYRQDAQKKVQEYADPSSERLLPDLPPSQAPYIRTLVLDLDDTIIKSDWKRERGWRTFKRPGVDAFLKQVSQFYEVVVYTDQLQTYADPILDRLDPNRQYIHYRLYRDATKYTGGEHVRDLSQLNRDLSRVILISPNEKAFRLQPDNAIQVRPYNLEKEDTVLLDLMPFLESICRTNVPDVRQVVRSYRGLDVPTEFKRRMKDVQEKSKERKSKSRGFFNPIAPQKQ
mmetsp:Transcript_1145/g.7465  ORF Transcript_1145/g.7465 Transcript_1145/m.7465 type:complete len:280 (+) Transcript_1145:198-1037(+)